MKNIIEWKSPKSGAILILNRVRIDFSLGGCSNCAFYKETEHNSACSYSTYSGENFPDCVNSNSIFKLIDIKDGPIDINIKSRMKLIKDGEPKPNTECLIFKNNSGFSVATFENNGYWKRKPSSKSNVKVIDTDLWIYIENL